MEKVIAMALVMPMTMTMTMAMTSTYRGEEPYTRQAAEFLQTSRRATTRPSKMWWFDDNGGDFDDSGDFNDIGGDFDDSG